MSHITKGKVDIAYRDAELLKKAIAGVGVLRENEKITIALGGDSYKNSSERYPLVLENPTDPRMRVGFKQEGESYVPFYDNWGNLGKWSNVSMARLKDRYIAHHYESKLQEEGFKTEVVEQRDGTLDVVFEEVAW